jgi:hypothetical protein
MDLIKRERERMHWVLESNLQDFGYLQIFPILKRMNIPYSIVKVVPYKNILLDPNFDTFNKEPTDNDNININAKKIFPFGTMGLSRVAKERDWKPGSLFNEEFTFLKWSAGFGIKNLLNEESKIMKFSDDLEFKDSMFFIRPCDDNKAFSGQVTSRDKFIDWQKSVVKVNNQLSKLNSETMITIAPYKEIINEARMFIFDGKVVTGSYYKIGAKVIYKEVLNDDPVISYTNKVIENYNPAKAFVIDIALTEKGYKIIEINNINSVGLYNANVDKFVDAVMNTL